MNNTDNWQKLAETHAIYLQNNGITIQTQIVDLMGLNTGGVLWVASEHYTQAKALLENISENIDENYDEKGLNGE